MEVPTACPKCGRSLRPFLIYHGGGRNPKNPAENVGLKCSKPQCDWRVTMEELYLQLERTQAMYESLRIDAERAEIVLHGGKVIHTRMIDRLTHRAQVVMMELRRAKKEAKEYKKQVEELSNKLKSLTDLLANTTEKVRGGQRWV